MSISIKKPFRMMFLFKSFKLHDMDGVFWITMKQNLEIKEYTSTTNYLFNMLQSARVEFEVWFTSCRKMHVATTAVSISQECNRKQQPKTYVS